MPRHKPHFMVQGFHLPIFLHLLRVYLQLGSYVTRGVYGTSFTAQYNHRSDNPSTYVNPGHEEL